MSGEPPGKPARTLGPVVVALWVASIVGGTAVGVAFLYPDEWALWRRVAAGLVLGVGTALILTANRLIGRSESI
jgi:hypothetical protein